MSDVHCPATLVLSTPTRAALAGDLSSGGSGSLASGEKLAAVWAGSEDVAAELASRLGVPMRADDGLREAEGPESDDDVVRRCRAGLEEVADLHRGETVLVVLDERTLGLAVPALTGRAAPGPVVGLAHDQDGWVLG